MKRRLVAALLALLAGMPPSPAGDEGSAPHRLPPLGAACPPYCVHPVVLAWHGGGLLREPRVYLDFWGPEWIAGWQAGGYSSRQAERYLTDLFGAAGGSAWSLSLVGLGVRATPQPLAGSWHNPASVPNFSDSAVCSHPTGGFDGCDYLIQQEAHAAALHFGGIQPDGMVVVALPADRPPRGFGAAWCGYHGYSLWLEPYIVLPYEPSNFRGCGQNFVNKADDAYGHGYFDGFSMVGLHEWGEAATDFDLRSGWFDDFSGLENGDVCAWDRRYSQNVWLGGQFFAAQPMWVNRACVIYPTPGLPLLSTG